MDIKPLKLILYGFQSISCLPQTINMESLNDGSGISNTFSTNFARWQKSCKDNINSTQIDGAENKTKIE